MDAKISNFNRLRLNSEENRPNFISAALSNQLFNPFSSPDEEPENVKNLFNDNVSLMEEWHSEFFFEFPNEPDAPKELGWKLRERTKTSAALLVFCLNIGTDPPDSIKPNPCARRECWIEPILPRQKGLELIGNALQLQYEKLLSKIKYKQCLDPTAEDLRKVALNMRKTAKNERILFHYNGHGVPRPTKNGEIWLFGKHYTHYQPVSIHDIRSCVGDPAVYLFDCSAAGVLIPHLIDMHSSILSSNEYHTPNHGNSRGVDNTNKVNMSLEVVDTLKTYSQQQLTHVMSGPQHLEGPCIVLAACKADETLPTNPLYPADIFTCCLTTPISIALNWLILQNPYSLGDVPLDLSENLPGKEGDRKTPRGELYWIFTAITDTIAWSSLPSTTFQKIYRQEMLVATLFRNFLLARRIMKSFSCTCQSWPILPDTSNHPLWQTWDLAAECCLLHVYSMLRGSPMVNPKNNMPLGPTINTSIPLNNLSQNGRPIDANLSSPSLPFFTEQLISFEIWLDYGSKSTSDIPIHLPIILQVLLSPTHRLRALILLKRYLATGPHAVSATLQVGIFPYILRLLQSSSNDIRQVLVAIWAHVIGYDISCRNDLFREKHHIYFIQFVGLKEYSLSHRCLAMFILTMMCSRNREGQSACIQQNLHRVCTTLLANVENYSSTPFIKWTCLCLSKLCEDSIWPKYLCITEAGHTHLYRLLVHEDPTVRATAIITLSEVFGASNLSRNSTHHSSVNLMNIGSIPVLGGPNPAPTNTYHARSNSDMSISSVESLVDPRELREAELQLALQLLSCCTDGCVAVRYEAVIALSKFVVLQVHLPCFTAISRQLIKMGVIESPAKLRHSFSFAPATQQYPLNSSPSLVGPSSKQSNTKNEPVTNSSSASPDMLAISLESTIFPWKLPSHMTQTLVDEIRRYLESQGIGTTPPETPAEPSFDVTDQNGIFERKTTPSGVQLSSIMAGMYVRLWLAIYEIQGKDPHIHISKAASALCQRVLDQLQYEDAKKEWENAQDNSAANVGNSNLWLSDMYDQQTVQQTEGTISYAPLSPIGLSLHASPDRGNDRGRTIGYNVIQRPLPLEQSGMEKNHGQPTQHERDQEGRYGQHQLVWPHPSNASLGSASTGPKFSGNMTSHGNVDIRQNFVPFKSDYGGDFYQAGPLLSSSFYCWSKRSFVRPDTNNDSVYEDALAPEGNSRLFRQERLTSTRTAVKKLIDIYKPLDDSQDYQVLDRKTKEEQQAARSVAIASMPQSVTKFEQKTVLNIDNAKMTSILTFHSLNDVLATSDGHNIKIWSTVNGNKIMEVFNAHNHLGSLSTYSSTNSNSGNWGPSQGSSNGVVNATSSSSSSMKSRITSINWINESYETLLMVGSDNGNINVWKDITESGDGSSAFSRTTSGLDIPERNRDLSTSQHRQQSSSRKPGYEAHASLYSTPNANICVATSFAALPDIAETSRGSGMIVSWIQESGAAIVAGNSGTIRIWDLQSEQCSRTFSTGLDTCTTALATKPVSSSFFSSSLSSSSFLRRQDSRGESFQHLQVFDDKRKLSWLFAGFADGTVSIFDERVSSSNTRVQSARADAGSWIVAAYTRHDLPQVITAAVTGTVRFWDIRNMRVYKSLEVFKHPLTALAVHPCLPVMATGSHAQIIKVFTMGGDQLDRDIKYHDGFLGQRIGPVSCLAFHPHRMMLASGATDNLVSIYAPTDA